MTFPDPGPACASTVFQCASSEVGAFDFPDPRFGASTDALGFADATIRSFAAPATVPAYQLGGAGASFNSADAPAPGPAPPVAPEPPLAPYPPFPSFPAFLPGAALAAGPARATDGANALAPTYAEAQGPNPAIETGNWEESTG